MSATAEGGGEPILADADSTYFRAIEDAFIRLRGAPLLLSPGDFQVAARWRREEVPLGLVVATLEEVFAKRRERGARGRINSLRYCAPAVDAAWSEVQELRGPAARETIAGAAPAGERLEALATALPASLAGREAWAARLRALDGPPEEVEGSLRRLDGELLAAAEAALSPASRERLADEVESILDGLRDRFPDEELVALRGQLWRQRLRRQASLPVLTLF